MNLDFYIDVASRFILFGKDIAFSVTDKENCLFFFKNIENCNLIGGLLTTTFLGTTEESERSEGIGTHRTHAKPPRREV